MNKLFLIISIITGFGFGSATAFATASIPAISITPESPTQGEPVLITVVNAELDRVAKIIFENHSLWFFEFKSQPTAVIPIDLNAKTGPRKIEVRLEDGSKIEKTFSVVAREKIEAPLGIPDKLGGNTPQAQTNLVTNLAKENLTLNNIFSASKRYWSQAFRPPVTRPQTTDSYGYLRKTGYYTIPHKGADFKAKPGTLIYPINRGVVRLAKKFEIYGNTGYALSPHLHLSIKVNGNSIDPIKFLDLFK